MLKHFIDSHNFIFVTLLALFTANTAALPGDREQPIQIDADSAERNERTGITSYIGSVELTQGSLKILANRIDIYTINGEVDHTIATGESAYLTQQQSADKGPVEAWANKIKYSMNTEIVNLMGDARIEQEGSIVESPEIDYFADQELVTAKGNAGSKNERVHVTLPPKNNGDKSSSTDSDESIDTNDEKNTSDKQVTTEDSLVDIEQPTENPEDSVITTTDTFSEEPAIDKTTSEVN